MYLEHFGLTEAPFSIAPNPRYLYMSRRHQDALAHLLYGVQGEGGFILLTGEVGAGKTTLCRCLLEQVSGDVEIAFVLNPRVTAEELLATICDEFEIAHDGGDSPKALIDRLNLFLLDCHSNHRKAVLIIDEAQNLTRDLLEQLRLLTNLETSERKLLQIVLLGQPELLETLGQRNLRQFSQRITARFHLEALGRQETRDYISHRMQTAGGDPGVFTRAATRRVFSISRGVPRVINLVCDRSLLGAYAADTKSISAGIVNRAAREVLGAGKPTAARYALTAAASVLAAAAVLFFFPRPAPAPAPPPVLGGHERVESAYHDLFALWGWDFADRATPPCRLAGEISLQCLSHQAPLSELKSLNRPAIVELHGRYLTISRIGPDEVTLIAGPEQYALNAGQFESVYSGRVEMLWRTPPAWEAPLRIPDHGAAVDRLVARLSVMDGIEPPFETGLVYNESLAARVRDFQASVGLAPSGVVDPLTWIHINNVEGANVPTLHDGHRS